MAKVSIIIPVYNVEKYIKQCLNSFISQTFDDIEIILIDDKSPDRCPEICDEYAKRDGRVIVVHHQQNKGTNGAIVSGLRQATSDYIMFADSDDFAATDYVETFYSTITKNKVDCVSSGFTEYYEKETRPVYRAFDKTYSKQEIETGLINPFYQDIESISKTFGASRWAKIYNTEKLRIASKGVNPKLIMGEDLDLNIRFLMLCDSVHTISDYGGYYYRCSREQSTTNRYDVKLFEQTELMLTELERFGKEIGKDISKIRKINDSTHVFHEIEKCLKSKTEAEEKVGFINCMLTKLSKQLLLENSSHEAFLYLNSDLILDDKLLLCHSILKRIEQSEALLPEQKNRYYIDLIFRFVESSIPLADIIEQVQTIKNNLTDQRCILEFAKTQSINGKISCWLIYLGLESVLVKILSLKK